jgi:hypothetical protein
VFEHLQPVCVALCLAGGNEWRGTIHCQGALWVPCSSQGPRTAKTAIEKWEVCEALWSVFPVLRYLPRGGKCSELVIQMYATAEFDFTQAENGWLMSGNALMRAIFLIKIFPRIITKGRSYFASRSKATVDNKREPEITLDIPTEPQEILAPSGTQAEGEPVIPDPAVEKAECEFDLFFLRWSLVIDGLLTAVTALATRNWHVYLGEWTRFS